VRDDLLRDLTGITLVIVSITLSRS